MLTIDTLDLLDEGMAWSAARIAAVPADALDAPTPCREWDLRTLLDHTVGTLTVFTDALAGPASSWETTMAGLTARSREAWRRPGVMDRSYDLPFGTMPGGVMASANLLEAVVHGWDISRASGERAPIPAHLAAPVLAFAREAIGDDQRGAGFGVAVEVDGSPSDQLVAFLGRTP